ncbi:hypothetical protein ANCDUO_01349 [Ancylostoma duodenale]|uniref:C-type lectin domain-containing protein n=1 Tax=Ancylostoma duodenale TaxID=51022 RepID=A0A0C2HFE4_9BILA|nr:hypothetical protein ANCDUO_01349 [Ancylostoma duodenale]
MDRQIARLQSQKYCFFFQRHYQSFDAHLAVINNEAKNNYIKVNVNPHLKCVSHWIVFSVMNRTGVWSIRSCDQLHSFVCQMVVVRK